MRWGRGNKVARARPGPHTGRATTRPIPVRACRASLDATFLPQKNDKFPKIESILLPGSLLLKLTLPALPRQLFFPPPFKPILSRWITPHGSVVVLPPPPSDLIGVPLQFWFWSCAVPTQASRVLLNFCSDPNHPRISDGDGLEEADRIFSHSAPCTEFSLTVVDRWWPSAYRLVSRDDTHLPSSLSGVKLVVV